ncbi:MAG: DUF1559 domain-containing protein, partial [Lacipirellulaceae bacterium]
DYAASSGTAILHDGATWFNNAAAPPALDGDYSAVDAHIEAQFASKPINICEPATRSNRNIVIRCQDGVSFVASEVEVQQIEDGTSNTYLFGEKNINPNEYAGGTNLSSDSVSFNTNQAAYCGYEWDNQKVAWSFLNSTVDQQEEAQPAPDRPLVTNPKIFGSAHPGGFNMVYCDGSVQTISYDVDPFTHSYSASRNDGQVISQ